MFVMSRRQRLLGSPACLLVFPHRSRPVFSDEGCVPKKKSGEWFVRTGSYITSNFLPGAKCPGGGRWLLTNACLVRLCDRGNRNNDSPPPVGPRPSDPLWGRSGHPPFGYSFGRQLRDLKWCILSRIHSESPVRIYRRRHQGLSATFSPSGNQPANDGHLQATDCLPDIVALRQRQQARH